MGTGIKRVDKLDGWKVGERDRVIHQWTHLMRTSVISERNACKISMYM